MSRQLYDAWGNIRSGVGTMPTDIGYTGQRLDNATGLMFYGARYYSPAVGRFISADSIVPDTKNPQQFNRYAYTLNNPVKYTDPTGHYIYEGDWVDPTQSSFPTGPYTHGNTYFLDPADSRALYGIDTPQRVSMATVIDPYGKGLPFALAATSMMQTAGRPMPSGFLNSTPIVAGGPIANDVFPEPFTGAAKGTTIQNSNSIRSVSPYDVAFSQRSAGGRGRYGPLYESMSQKGWDGPPIDVVETPQGLTSVDNTRLAIARELNLGTIPAQVHAWNEPLTTDMSNRFGGALTWGDALAYRLMSQRPPLPLYGTHVIPRLPGH